MKQDLPKIINVMSRYPVKNGVQYRTYEYKYISTMQKFIHPLQNK